MFIGIQGKTILMAMYHTRARLLHFNWAYLLFSSMLVHHYN